MKGFLGIFVMLTTLAANAWAEDPPVFLLKWGSFGSANGQLNTPGGIATDNDGNVYVVDNGNDRIQKFSNTGAFLGAFGGSGNQNGQFDHPFDVALAPNGDIYVTDWGNQRVQVFDNTFAFLRQWPANPWSIAIDPTGAFAYVTRFDGSVVQYETNGALVRSWTYTMNPYTVPEDITVGASGTIYIASLTEDKIRKYSASGQFMGEWGVPGDNPGELSSPVGIATDPAENVFVSDGNKRVQKYTSDGTFLSQWGSRGSGDGQFESVFDVAVDASKHIFTIDPVLSRVQQFVSPSTPVRRTTWGLLKASYR